MITVKRLKELLKQVPDDAAIYAYEGERCGIQLQKGANSWWIRMGHSKAEDTFIEGFVEEVKND